MAVTQKYGIKYPFTYENNEEIYVDLDKTYFDSIKSKVLHVLFTPKGQRLRNPDFGTDLIKFIFEPSDETTLSDLKTAITLQISKYVKNVVFNDISIYDDESDSSHKIVIIKYTVKTGNKETLSTVGIRL